MVSLLAERLKAARHQNFVGREAERELVESALQGEELPFNVLYIYGPGGIGKTSLLNEFAHLCGEAGVPNGYLDARNLEPIPEAFETALRRSLQVESGVDLGEALAARSGPSVLFIDTYERLLSLDDWLRQIFLPQLPANVLTVLAGREEPPFSWLADQGWQSLFKTMPLRNLSGGESRQYLSQHQIPPTQHSAILNFTYGHPLALSLVVDICAQRPDIPANFQIESAKGVVKILLDRLVQKVPGPLHRAALEACAVVRVLTETLLAEMLDRTDVYELFAWLHELSFIDVGRDGLFPHDLVREALTADLRWRNPDGYAQLHARARAYYVDRLQRVASQVQQQLIMDYIYLHRENPMVRPFFEWQTAAGSLPDGLRPEDVPTLTAMVAHHEGAESAHLAAYWFRRQPKNILVLRDLQGQPTGFLAPIALHDLKPDDLRSDPVIEAAWRYLQNHGSLRPGERATHFRFWMAADTYQAVSPTQTLIFFNIVRHYLTTPGLAFTFFPCADTAFWEPICLYADLTRLPETDYTVNGRSYGVYGHDWRMTPPMPWLEMLAEREVAVTMQTAPPVFISEPVVVLSQADFDQAVRDALRDLHRAEAGLIANPLLRSRLIVQQAGVQATESERVAALQTALQDAVASLHSSPREAKFYRALYHTYLQPAPSQERAAEVLDVPFSTYRRHLKAGLDRVSQILWQQEISSLEKINKW